MSQFSRTSSCPDFLDAGGEEEAGAAVLLAISQESGKSVDWLLTGKGHVQPKKRVAKSPSQLR
jgi:hypothetical protein